jgi:hypothetical protein
MMSVDVIRPKASTFLEFSPQAFQSGRVESIRRDDPSACEIRAPARSVAWSMREMVDLAQLFIDRTEALLDVAPPPAWEDADDIFDGEVFAEEQAQEAQSLRQNLTAVNDHRN